jgi:hypothetical protein
MHKLLSLSLLAAILLASPGCGAVPAAQPQAHAPAAIPPGQWAYPIPEDALRPQVAPQIAPAALSPELPSRASLVDDFERIALDEGWTREARPPEAASGRIARRPGTGFEQSFGLSIRHDGAGFAGADGPVSATELAYAIPASVRHSIRQQGARVSAAFFDDMANAGQHVGLALRGEEVGTGDAGAISIGIWPDLSRDFYVYCVRQNAALGRQNCIPTHKRRSSGWHTLQINVTPKGSYAAIDGESLSFWPATYLPARGTVAEGGLNTRLASADEIALFVRDAGGDRRYAFDQLALEPYPPFVSEAALAEEKLRLFLSSYENLALFRDAQGNKHQRFDDNKFPVFDPAIIQRLAHAHALRYLLDGGGDRNHPDYIKAVDVIRYMVGFYNYSDDYLQAWNDPDLNNEGKGDPLNHYLGVIHANKLLNVAWLLWDDLPDDLRQRLAGSSGERPGVLIHMARRVERLMADDANITAWARPQYAARSKQESNGWLAVYFFNMAMAFQSHPNAGCWYEYAKFFALNTFSTGQSSSVGVCDGSGNVLKTISVTTRTINDDLLVDEHDYHPNVQYTFGSVNILSVMQLLNRRLRGGDEPAFGHRVPEVYERVLAFVDLYAFQFKGPQITRRTIDSSGRIVEYPFVDVTQHYSPFKPSRRDEGIADASSLTIYRTLAELYGERLNSSRNLAGVPQREFVSDDIARHSAEFIHYTRDGYLWKPTGAYGESLPPETPLVGVFNGVPLLTLLNNHAYTLQQNGTVANDMLGAIQYFDLRVSGKFKALALP